MELVWGMSVTDFKRRIDRRWVFVVDVTRGSVAIVDRVSGGMCSTLVKPLDGPLVWMFILNTLGRWVVFFR